MNSLRFNFISTRVLFFVLFFTFAFFTTKVEAFSDGTGSSGDPYIISTCADLQDMNLDLAAHYALGSDIDCTATESWNENTDEWVDGIVGGELISDSYNDIPNKFGSVVNNGYYGFASIGTNGSPFTGTFDGNGHTVSNLWIFRKQSNWRGLFGYAEGATIQNFTLQDSHIVGQSSVGGIVGHATDSTIQNVTTQNNSVRAYLSYYGGGIVGFMIDSTLENVSVVGGAVHGSGNVIGGIVGQMNSGSISNSDTSANVDGGESIGGAIGFMATGTINNLIASGNVHTDYSEVSIAKSGQWAGGLVGFMELGTISSSTASGNVECSGDYCGGFAGIVYDAGAVISNSSSTGNVATLLEHGNPSYVGGFAGSIENNYSYDAGDPFAYGTTLTGLSASGNVSATSSIYVGGFAGKIKNRSIINATSSGSVIAGTYVGGFSGFIEHSDISHSAVTGEGVISGSNGVGGFAGQLLCESRIDNSNSTVNVTGAGTSVGGFAGDSVCGGIGPTVIDSYATGEVTGQNFVGGFIGSALKTELERVYAEGNVLGSAYVGGLVGNYSAYSPSLKITDSHATGNVTGGQNVGGLVGITAESRIEKSYATGDVNASGSYAGGFAGQVNGHSTITTSYALGDVSATSASLHGAGGFVGYVAYNAFVYNSYARGTITAPENTESVGGFVGFNVGDILYSYSTGNVSTTDTTPYNTGGFAGYNGWDSIYSSYSVGTVTTPATDEIEYKVGGFIGINDHYHQFDSGWLTSAGPTNAVGLDNMLESPIASLAYNTTNVNNFKNQNYGLYLGTWTNEDTISYDGIHYVPWDFSTIWGIDGSVNNGFPYLRPFTYDHSGTSTPALTTSSASSIAPTSATLNGEITYIGSAPVTVRGFEYGITTGYGSTLSTSGSYTTGAYTESPTGLTCNTLYYFRAFGTNSVGTDYGLGQSFTTSACSSVGGSSGGGGNGHTSGGRSGGSTSAVPVASVNLVATTTPVCSLSLYPTQSIKMGALNNSEQVKLLEQFLNLFEKANLPVDGAYSLADENAVKAWQEKYASEILTPWGATKGTGYVFRTSLAKMRSMFLSQCSSPQVVPQVAPPVSVRDLDVGMSGSDVKSLQTLLIEQGYSIPAGATGYFAGQTKSSLAAYQTKFSIPSTGYFGIKTRTQMKSVGLNGLWW
jgi:hypothetical protein